MTDKIKLLFKSGFIFSLLIIWGYFIIPVAGSPAKDFNVPIYINTSAGIERANSDVIVNILSNYNFEIKKMQEYAPDEQCSLRADAGSLEIDGIIFDGSHLNFYIPLKNDGPGQGEIYAQKDRIRFSLKFEVQEILVTNSSVLVFKAKGKGSLDRQELNFNEIIVGFDKVNNKVYIKGTGDKDFLATGLEVSFIRWCSGQETVFYLITTQEKLGTPRSLEEVNQILEEHPEFIDMYEGLRNLNPNVIPEFGLFIGALTVLSAVGIFFFLRKR